MNANDNHNSNDNPPTHATMASYARSEAWSEVQRMAEEKSRQAGNIYEQTAWQEISLLAVTRAVEFTKLMGRDADVPREQVPGTACGATVESEVTEDAIHHYLRIRGELRAMLMQHPDGSELLLFYHDQQHIGYVGLDEEFRRTAGISEGTGKAGYSMIRGDRGLMVNSFDNAGKIGQAIMPFHGPSGR